MNLIEAVPNISEGRDTEVIQAARRAVEAGGSTVLGVEPDTDYNRTVLTYVGSHEQVVRSSIELIRVTTDLIDMRQHEGNHPRMGAVDVMPFIALGETSFEDAQRVADEVYEEFEGTHSMFRYGRSATLPSRSRLPTLRKGGYEGLKDRFLGGRWNNDETRLPDNWNGVWSEVDDKFGAMAIGVRPVLIAYNVNVREEEPTASAVAAKVIRSSGFPIKSESGSKSRVRGLLSSVQGMGVPLESHGISQVSMNLSDPSETSIHLAYETVKSIVEPLGVEVFGSEIVGLVPLGSMLEAGRWYHGYDADHSVLVTKAIEGLGLDSLGDFDPNARIIEWALDAAREV